LALSRYARQALNDEVTSQSHPVYLIPLGLPKYNISLTVPPGYKESYWVGADYACVVNRDIGADIARLNALGVNRLITLMDGQDILDSGMGGLETELDGYGIQWAHLPIMEGPESNDYFERELSRFSSDIWPSVKSGEHIAIHSDGWNSGIESHLPKILMAIDESLDLAAARRHVEVALFLSRAFFSQKLL
jgi:hypothetical protein